MIFCKSCAHLQFVWKKLHFFRKKFQTVAWATPVCAATARRSTVGSLLNSSCIWFFTSFLILGRPFPPLCAWDTLFDNLSAITVLLSELEGACYIHLKEPLNVGCTISFGYPYLTLGSLCIGISTSWHFLLLSVVQIKKALSSNLES